MVCPAQPNNQQQREGAASELSLLGVMGRSPSAPHGFHSTNSFFSFVSFHLLCLNPLIIKEETSPLLELINERRNESMK